jgi:hypothetical protein
MKSPRSDSALAVSARSQLKISSNFYKKSVMALLKRTAAASEINVCGKSIISFRDSHNCKTYSNILPTSLIDFLALIN